MGLQQGLAIIVCGLVTAASAFRAGAAIGSGVIQTHASKTLVHVEARTSDKKHAVVTMAFPVAIAALCSGLTVQVTHATARASKLHLVAGALLLAPCGAAARWRLSQMNSWSASAAPHCTCAAEHSRTQVQMHRNVRSRVCQCYLLTHSTIMGEIASC